MNQQQALEILVKAVEIAQSKGAYSLDDAAVLKTAIDVFRPKEEAPKPQPQPEVEPTIEMSPGTSPEVKNVVKDVLKEIKKDKKKK